MDIMAYWYPRIDIFTKFQSNSLKITSKFWHFSKDKKNIRTDTVHTYIPIQLRLPPLNGKKANGCLWFTFSGKKWSGLNWSASSPQISGLCKKKITIQNDFGEFFSFTLSFKKTHAMHIKNGHHDESWFRHNAIAELNIGSGDACN